MKVIVAGGRNFTEAHIVSLAIADAAASGIVVTELVCGGAKGVDSLAANWAGARSIPIRCFFPDWHKYGLSAGPRRNAQMAAYADALVAVWDGASRGTGNMIEQATNAGLRVHIHRVKEG